MRKAKSNNLKKSGGGIERGAREMAWWENWWLVKLKTYVWVSASKLNVITYAYLPVLDKGIRDRGRWVLGTHDGLV